MSFLQTRDDLGKYNKGHIATITHLIADQRLKQKGDTTTRLVCKYYLLHQRRNKKWIISE